MTETLGPGSTRAHPRSRGEHQNTESSADFQGGSSPLARGARRQHGRINSVTGLIPARAGSTALLRGCLRPPRAHPRSRGEHMNIRGVMDWLEGSSPLARGALLSFPKVRGVVGLIPARAGSTAEVRRYGGCSGAHPRSRGEHPKSQAAPRLKGWLIPARAGSTSILQPSVPGVGAHPRSRGEHSSSNT